MTAGVHLNIKKFTFFFEILIKRSLIVCNFDFDFDDDAGGVLAGLHMTHSERHVNHVNHNFATTFIF